MVLFIWNEICNPHEMLYLVLNMGAVLTLTYHTIHGCCGDSNVSYQHGCCAELRTVPHMGVVPTVTYLTIHTP